MPKTPSPREPWEALTVMREKDGYGKSAFAKALNVSLGHLCDLESGRREPTPTHVRRAAVVLNVPMSMLEKRRRISAEDVA